MDDLLKAFLAETSQGLAGCEAALDRLRRSPDDADAVAGILEIVRSIRETSAVMGLPELQAAAALAAEAASAMAEDEPGAGSRMLPVAADRLAQMGALIRSIEQAGGVAEPDLSGFATEDDEWSPPTRCPANPAGGAAVLAVKRPKRKKKLTGIPDGLATAPLVAPRQARDDRSQGAGRMLARRSAAGSRRLRHVLLAIGAALAVPAIAVLLLARTIDVKAYGALIAGEVESATGRKLTIGGDLDLGFSLTPTVIANDVSLANMADSSRPEMLTVRRLELQFALLPLLHGEVRIKRLVLVGGDILLERDAEGRANWLLGDAAQGSDAAATPDTTPQSAGTALPSIKNLVIAGTRLTYRDAGSGETHMLLIDRLAATARDGADPVRIALEGSADGEPITLSGSLGPLRALLGNQAVSVDLTGEIAGNRLSAKGTLGRPLEAKVVQLAFHAAGETLASLAPALGVALPNAGPYELATTISDAEGGYRFDGIEARLGQSDAAGALTLRRDGPRPRLDGHLAATSLDLADFAERGAGAASAAPHDRRLFSDAPLPLDLLSAIDGSVRLAADRFVAGSLALQRVALELSLADGRLDIRAFQAGLADGTVTGMGAIATGNGAPAWELDLQAQQVGSGELLRALFGSTALRGGRSDLVFKLRSRGNSLRAVMAALDGSASLAMTGGRVDDGLVDVALADIGESLMLAGGNDGGQVNCAVAQLDLADGIAESRRMVADLRGAVIAGGGRIDLRNETIAMRFTPASKRTSLASFAGPFDVVGPLAAPAVRPDAAATATNAIGAVASVGTLGIADSIAGLAGINLTNKAAAGTSCVAVAETPIAAPPPKPASKSASKPAGGRASTRKGASGGFLDQVGARLEEAGAGLQNLFDGAAPANNKSARGQGSKESR